MTHTERIAELTATFNASMARFLSRLDGATPEQLTRTPDDGGWSAAQVAWHVGVINDAFAGLIDGSVPNARQAPEGFTETPWSEIAEKVPEKLVAPERFHPPAIVTSEEGLEKVRSSQQRIVDALAGLDPERAKLTVRSTIGTPINLYQVGTWAATHVARHNAQVKRLLGV